MDIKKLQGSLEFDDFTNGIVAYGNCKTFGEVWEKCVNCDHCDHRTACEEFAAEYDKVSCSQFIDFLLGHKTLEEIIKEVKNRGTYSKW